MLFFILLTLLLFYFFFIFFFLLPCLRLTLASVLLKLRIEPAVIAVELIFRVSFLDLLLLDLDLLSEFDLWGQVTEHNPDVLAHVNRQISAVN